MATTLEQMVTLFPELANVDRKLIRAALDNAPLEVSAESFGDAYDQAVRLKAMHILAMTPAGEPLRLNPKMDREGHGSIYGKRFAELASTRFLSMVVV